LANQKLPKDHAAILASGVQVLWPNPVAHQSFAIGAASARNAVPIDAFSVVEISSDVDCFIRFGDGTVVAVVNDKPTWAKSYMVYHTFTATHIAAITSGAAGRLFISVLQ